MASYTDIDDKTDVEAVSHWLSKFLNDPSAATSLTLPEKTELVNALISDLDVQQAWSDEVRLLALQTLKILGRVVDGCGRLLSDEGFRILMTLATLLPEGGDLQDTLVTQEALTCIANALLLEEDTRDLFNKYEGVEGLTRGLKKGSLSIKTEFLTSRILFVMTVRPLPSVESLVDRLGIIDILEHTVSTHVEELGRQESSGDVPMQITRVMILNEQLKLLFNLMMNDPKIEKVNKEEQPAISFKFEKLLAPVLRVITELKQSGPFPMTPPHSHAVHALLNFPVAQYKKVWFPDNQKEGESHLLIDKLVDMLKKMVFFIVKGDPDDNNSGKSNGLDMDEAIAPFVVLLKKLAEDDYDARVMLKSKLLPDNIDRSKPLEKGESLTARLIRLMTSVMLPHLRDGVSELLFKLCDENASLFVHHVGYGNAAGFLMSHNITIPSSDPTAPIYSEKPINPITGQYMEDAPLSLANMTDEEKEREAERLFVLFERLKKTGVMDVVNPVQEAINSGKIREIEERIAKKEVDDDDD
ncbi:7958_t:CDS:2 [Paraglomus brasilianum]|uniref:7958_t:CDS:1 n=1 Tax=Paraglomus brasilianum TaxID=144538 RepID=A0A9N8ZUL3_9GLOM|nr:7958_t:CDS:2 [Paraglomus brasilianum]